MRTIFGGFLIIFLMFSCTKQPKYNVDVSGIDTQVTLVPFHQKFYTSTIDSLHQLKDEYPFLFPTNVSDSVWIEKINNKDEQVLYQEVQQVYKNLDVLELELESLFDHIQYYYPKYSVPTVYTVLSNVDYDYRTILTPKRLFISLDVYLGGKHPFYSDFPEYIKHNNTPKRIVVDVANEIVKTQITSETNRSFLHKIIKEGKKQYLLDAYLPELSDTLKIGYTHEKMQWAVENEENIWMYFIENQLLYSTDTKLNKRFIDQAPFSKFYLSEDTKSPGRIGVWVGWQIVRSYMENNDVSLQSLLKKPSEEIFKNSKYKPRK